MTKHITIATFHGQEDVDKTVQDLIDAGIPRDSIRISNDTSTYADGAIEGKGFWESVGDFFMPDEERDQYTTAQSDGGILMSVASDDTNTHVVEDILQEFGVLEESGSSVADNTWSAGTGAGIDVPMSTSHDTAARYASETDLTRSPMGRSGTDGDVLSVVEEDIQIGKRAVSGGRMRARSYVVETPFSEDVNLRSETVEVVRNRVDRPAADTDLAFAETEIEAEAMSEEAVVSKSARVVEEVSLRKTATDRSQTVTDTLRSTKVDVLDDDGNVVTDTSKMRH